MWRYSDCGSRLPFLLPEEQTVKASSEAGKAYRLHPVHTAANAGDKRATEARYDAATGSFTIPPRTAVVFVE